MDGNWTTNDEMEMTKCANKCLQLGLLFLFVVFLGFSGSCFLGFLLGFFMFLGFFFCFPLAYWMFWCFFGFDVVFLFFEA